jgi:RNA ligase (TIGR02306 family)
MSKFEVLILPIDRVERQPDTDRYLNYIRGYVVSTRNLYREGQLVAYIPDNAILPRSLTKYSRLTQEDLDMGLRVEPQMFGSVLSQGVFLPTIEDGGFNYLECGLGHKKLVQSGENVTTFLGIKKWENPYLASSHGHALGYPIKYEVEDIKKYPDLINGKAIVTELLHGVICIVGYNRALADPWIITSGPMGTDGFRIRGDHIYERVGRPIINDIKRYLESMPAVEQIYIFGEIVGPGIQDLTYGLDKPTFYGFDIKMRLMGAGRDSIPEGFINYRKFELFAWLGIPTVPVLSTGFDYSPMGEFSQTIIKELTERPSAIGGGLRKGVVLTADDENFVGGLRPIVKSVSDKFLIRDKGTEFK